MVDAGAYLGVHGVWPKLHGIPGWSNRGYSWGMSVYVAPMAQDTVQHLMDKTTGYAYIPIPSNFQ